MKVLWYRNVATTACYPPNMTFFQNVRPWRQRTGPRRRLHWDNHTNNDQQDGNLRESRAAKSNPQFGQGSRVRLEDRIYDAPRSWTNREYRFRYRNMDYPVRDGRPWQYQGPRRDTRYARVNQNFQPWVPNRGTGFRRTRRALNRENERSTNTPEYKKFRETVRVMYNLIRSFHHLGKISVKMAESDPPTIANIVAYLSNILKPARMTKTTQLLLEGNARNWAHTSRLILEEHYLKDIEEGTQTLQSLVEEDWRSPFKIAVKWARGHFRSRLDEESVEKTEALLISIIAGQEETARDADPGPEPSEAHVSSFSEEDFPPLTRETCVESVILPGIRSMAPVTRQSTRAQPQRIRVNRERPKQGDSGADIRANPARATASQHPELEEISSCPEPERGHSIPRPRQSGEPLGISDWNVIVHTTGSQQDAQLTEPCSPTEVVAQGQTVEALAQAEDESLRQEEASGEVPLISLIDDDDGGKASYLPSPLFQSSPDKTPTQKFRPVRHLNTTRKMTEWGLTVKKKWLIMGDSNLARIPGHQLEDLQIDSYPGGTFRHAEEILSRAHVASEVEKIVLAFGINHRAQKAKVTAVKQLQRALKKAHDCFPRARIWVPVINFSKALKWDEQMALQALNKHIKKNVHFIVPLPEKEFSVMSDRIHWTPATAKAMFDHWVKELNL